MVKGTGSVRPVCLQRLKGGSRLATKDSGWSVLLENLLVLRIGFTEVLCNLGVLGLNLNLLHAVVLNLSLHAVYLQLCSHI